MRKRTARHTVLPHAQPSSCDSNSSAAWQQTLCAAQQLAQHAEQLVCRAQNRQQQGAAAALAAGGHMQLCRSGRGVYVLPCG